MFARRQFRHYAAVFGMELDLGSDDVRENQAVHEGEVLFRLDEAPFRIAVEEAAAQLATARLQIDSLKAMVRDNVKGSPQGIALEVIQALGVLVDKYLARA